MTKIDFFKLVLLAVVPLVLMVIMYCKMDKNYE